MSAVPHEGDGREQRFALGDLPLVSGSVLPDAQLSYRVLGRLNADRSNLVLMPSSYGAWPEDLSWTVGPILDPGRWCVVVISQFGNGRSSSPSHGRLPLTPEGWPVGHSDNLRAQRRLLEEVFRVESPALIYGWSMGAQQAFHWAALEPERVSRMVCLCGTACTTPHNRLFLLSLRQALTADRHWDGEGFSAPPLEGLRTFALIYASWAASQPFYRWGGHLELGFASVEDYVDRAWLPAYSRHDPRDLIAMLDVWLANDLGRALRQCDATASDPSHGRPREWIGRPPAPGAQQPGPFFPCSPASGGPTTGAPTARPTAAGTDAPSDPIEAGSGLSQELPPVAEDLAVALGRIRARCCVIAASHDLYFPPQDCAAEAALIPQARFTLLHSHLGHRAGNPRDAPREQALIRAELEALCAD